jgi:hypothetical protein
LLLDAALRMANMFRLRAPVPDTSAGTVQTSSSLESASNFGLLSGLFANSANKFARLAPVSGQGVGQDASAFNLREQGLGEPGSSLTLILRKVRAGFDLRGVLVRSPNALCREGEEVGLGSILRDESSGRQAGWIWVDAPLTRVRLCNKRRVTASRVCGVAVEKLSLFLADHYF